MKRSDPYQMKSAALLVFTALIFFCCNQQDTHVQGNTFYYYPRPNVYYDIERKEYYVFSPDANQWERKKELTEAQKTDLGEKVAIDTPSVPVYKSNAHHRLLYSASLYSREAEMQQKYIEDSLKSLPKPPPPKEEKPVTPKTEEDKGLKKFFKKIFGKEEDKKEEKKANSI